MTTFKLDVDPAETIFVPDVLTLNAILDDRVGEGLWDIELDAVENGLFHVVRSDGTEVGTLTYWIERRPSDGD